MYRLPVALCGPVAAGIVGARGLEGCGKIVPSADDLGARTFCVADDLTAASQGEGGDPH